MEGDIEIKPHRQKLNRPKFIYKERFDPDYQMQRVTVYYGDYCIIGYYELGVTNPTDLIKELEKKLLRTIIEKDKE